MTDEEITEKFKDCASSCLPPRQVNELVERLWDLENVESVRDIAKLLTTQS